MFDSRASGVGLLPGESHEDLAAEDHLAYEVTCHLLADGWSEPDRHVLPAGFDSMPPGPFLAAVVGSVDASRLNGHDVVRLMQARARLAAHDEAGKLEAMAAVAFAPPSDPESGVLWSSEQVEDAAVEIAAALTLTRRASDDELDTAMSLTGRLRRVWKAFSEGRLDLRKAKLFERFLGHLPDDTVDLVLDLVLEDASGLTSGQLRARLDRLVLEADPDGSKSSFEEGLKERKVTVTSNPDHTANLNIYSARPDDVVAARDYIEQIARALKTKDESRSLDEIRNDVALDLLRGGQFAGTKSGGGRTHVTVSAETLAGLSDKPGELNGYGPVFAEIARKTVMENVDGEWTFVVTDNGEPVATGTLARRPTEGMKRHIRAQYAKCTWVGCREDAWDCDLDHRLPYSQRGRTCMHNLAPLCRFHHGIKEKGEWKVERLANGDHQWTSPLGHTYISKRGPPD